MILKQFRENSQYGIKGYKGLELRNRQRLKEIMNNFCINQTLSAYNEHLKKHTHE